MIRSHNKHVSVGDRIKFLWTICLIAHYKEQGIPVTSWQVIQDFGPEVRKWWEVYREIAMEDKYIAPDSHTLTPKALRVIANWRRYRDKLTSID